ncbi:S16 family serine protease [Bifidobacterium sp. ESL0704]|uniref:YlbL family protein n=1 Tax=Bifidobacterium sp. ESL0704 TaxID=2983219 RepID=UPI0023F6CDFD|nr:S16 family serine protease [Bifidobacterium sp. ESL0704]WEV53394.1 Lon protease [Bifidobacterium sp. ESL0704]
MARSNQDQWHHSGQMPISQPDEGAADSRFGGDDDFGGIVGANAVNNHASSAAGDLNGINGTAAGSNGMEGNALFGVVDASGAGVPDTGEAGVPDFGRQGLWHRLVRYGSRHSLRYFAGLICAVLCFLVLLLPSPYVIETPGPTQDVLGESAGKAVIAITGATTHKSRGKLLLLTVNAQGVPGAPALGIQTLIAWIDPHQQVMPSEAVFPVGQSSQEYEQTSAKQMTGSQDSATAAALAFAKQHGIAGASHAKVEMHVDDIGGPSAGMMYALGVIDKLTSVDETGGKTIAGTGTIDKQGKVGKIGGIQLKMLGAKRDGATYFLAPASNCDEVVGHVPHGLRDVRVSTLDEAYRSLVAIGQGKADGLPHCTAN